jgi:hypothetical protein
MAPDTKVVVTNTFEGVAYTAESGVASVVVNPKASGKDVTHTRSYYATTGLSFNMNGRSVAGYVTVSFVDYGIRTSGNVDFPTPLGVLIAPTQVPYAPGDTSRLSHSAARRAGRRLRQLGFVGSGFNLEGIRILRL